MNNSHFENFLSSNFSNKILERNGEQGKAACEILAAAINAVNAYQCVSDLIHLKGDQLQIGEAKIDPDQFKRIFLIGYGKASVPMAKAILDILGDRITFAQVITKDEKFLTENGYLGKLQIQLGEHPVPSPKSVTATQNLLSGLTHVDKDDLVLVVISGGGSALLTSPAVGITVEELQHTTQILLNCGADISEINTLRKHLDRVKGGGLARYLYPAEVHAFVLSDVIGDRLDMIASGPTVPDPTTFSDAMVIIEKYQLRQELPKAIITHLENGLHGEIEETLKQGDPIFSRVHHHLVGTNIKACHAAKQKAESLGIPSLIISSHLIGDTRDVAQFMAGIIHSVSAHGKPLSPPCCLIFGGETTVTVNTKGKGGRNQDLALNMVKTMADLPGVLFISLATDGEDGPTDAAGAVVDHAIYQDGIMLHNFYIETFIESTDAYHYFEPTGGLIKIGATGTNVNDIMLVMFDRTAMQS